MTCPSRILIADDHGVFIDGLKQVIARTANMTVADEATNGQEVLAKIRDNEYDLLVLDISLPGRSGLDIMVEIKSIRPKLPVLILSMHPEEQYARRAIKSGAAGYLAKGSSSKELIQAIREITMGRQYVTASMAELLSGKLDPDLGGPLHERLSDREYQMLLLIAAGASPKRISEEMMVGIKTVNTYRVRILQKMEMKCNADLNSYAVQHKLM